MSLSQKAKEEMKEEAGYRCGIPTCNTTSPLEIHHIKSQADGGSDDPSNLMCLCRNCHGRVHNGEIQTQAIRRYKIRLVRLNTVLDPHHYRYLEALLAGEDVELSPKSIHLARKLENEGYISIEKIDRPVRYKLFLTEKGQEFIE
jgi:hypothetical protein